MLKTLIAVPCFDMVHADFMESFINLHKPAGTSWTMVKNTMVYDARNIIAGNAIKAGFDRVMWLDSDMTFKPDALEILSADMDSGYDFVTGIYYTRRAPNIKPVLYKNLWYKEHYKQEDGGERSGATNYYHHPEGIFEIAGAGFGCVLTSVDLLRRVGEEYGSPFQPFPTMGEDLSFCIRCINIGAKMYADSRVKCGHIGTYEYTEKDCTPLHHEP